MARTKTTLVLAIICFILIANEIEVCSAEQSRVEAQKIDCKGKCNYRCSKASRHKICIRACNACCNRCNCVPPGTSGNANVCPCYANMTTYGGRRKCP